MSWQAICLVFGDSSDPIRRSSAVHGNDVIDPIHIFALSNVLRRPLVVLNGDDRSVKMGGRDGGSNDVCGVYLPVDHDARTCCRSPIVLTVVAGHCVPLVFSAEMSANVPCSQSERGVPLVDSNFTTLPVRCLLSPNDRPEVLISQYLRTAELPLTTINTVNMVPVARIDTVEPPGEYSLITAWSNAAMVTSSNSVRLLSNYKYRLYYHF
jgi:OTU-like cysteine protease